MLECWKYFPITIASYKIFCQLKLFSCFVTEQVINFEEEQIIQETVGQTQAASVAMRKIANALQARQTRSFDKLLMIMEDHSGLSCSCEELANQMRGELLKNTSSTVTIAAYCM